VVTILLHSRIHGIIVTVQSRLDNLEKNKFSYYFIILKTPSFN